MIDPQKLTEQLKQGLDKNPSVAAFVLVGSWARETVYQASEFSDMEAYIVIKDEDATKFDDYLKDLTQKFGRVIFSYKNQWAGFSTVYEDLFRLELPIVKKSDLKSAFSRPKQQPVKVLLDKTNGELEKVLKERPTTLNFEKLFQDKVIDFWYMAILGVQYYKKGEIWNSRSVLQILQSAIIKFFELIQDPEILLLETNKRVEQFLSKEQLESLKKISPACEEVQIKQAFIKILDIFPTTCQQISQKYGYSYVKDIEKEVRPKLLELLI